MNPPALQVSFAPILTLIQQAKARAFAAVNHELIDLYWRVGQYISQKTEHDGWGKNTVQQLAVWLATQEPEARGFSASNLWRMRQFFDTYQADSKLAPLVRELPWTHNLLILAKCKSQPEREFYLQLAVQQRWGKRELERQIDGAMFERAVNNPTKISKALQETPKAEQVFRDSYLLEFLNLPINHSEADLQQGLVTNLKDFLLELGMGFCFVGQNYRVQVGNQDFWIDLLFFHRGLQALVVFELKISEFKPAHMGQLEFYLEALDRDHRQTHEAPSIGVLLCKSADSEVVEYALARTASPALVAQYMTQLPNKALLQAKLEEFYDLATRDEAGQ
jgi:predicted nuclease of restriction endonuclease-like (RecB) superfamily